MTAERGVFHRTPIFPCPRCGERVRTVGTLDGVKVIVLAVPDPRGDLDVIAWNRRYVWVDLHAEPHEPDYDADALRLKEHKHDG